MRRSLYCLLALCATLAGNRISSADELVSALPEDKVLEKPAATDADKPINPTPVDKLVPLNAKKTVFLDKDGGKLVLQTEVVFRAGLLEMLVCLKQTKEHESILSLDSEARVVHAGLLALGAKVGSPVQFLPEFQPPSGQVIEIWALWQDADGKWHRENAQRWVRHATRKYFIAELDALPEGLKIPESSDLRYDPKHRELLWFGIMSDKQRDELLSWSKDAGYQAAVKKLHGIAQVKPMTAEWVFTGSSFFVDEQTGQQFYRAESGDLICVANFASATIDVRERSTDSGEEGLAYEAWEERIPPLRTKVRVELVPVKDEPKANATDEKKPAANEEKKTE